MGAESSVLQGCRLEEPLETPSQSEWRLHPAKRKDGSRVSVFVHKKSEQEDHEDRRLEHAAKQLKILRHPTILKFFASCDNVEGTYLITEQVRPLEIVLDSLTPEEICAGLYNIAEALSFLHDRGGASHNNVCLSSIYVSVQDGGWRLGGMEHLCKFEDATAQFLKENRALRNAEAIPPEEQEDSLTSTAPQYGHARDAYAFGILAQNMLEYLTDLGSMSTNFEQRINDEFLHDEPMLRPRLSTLLNDQLFENDFLEIINFLVHLTVKSEAAKNAFFEGLAPRLHRLPRELVANRLAPLLLSSFVMAEPMAVSMVLPHFMTPLRESNKHREFLSDQVNPLFPEDLYKQYIIPVILEVFLSREMHVRLCLLQYFASYVDLFEVNVLKKGILPQLLIGLKDSHDELVSASLKGLADTVPILGAELVVGGERVKYFVEGRPKFFSNKESPLKKMDNVTNLTAVSGVITIPPLEKTPPTESTPAPVSDSGLASANEEEEEATAVAKQQERERRREEIRMKNEQRRREREAKKTQQSGKVTLLSMANLRNDSIESAGDTHSDTHSEEVSLRFEKVSHTDESEARSEGPGVTPPEDFDDLDLRKEDDDWSDWEDVNQSNQSAGSASPESKLNLSVSLLPMSREKHELDKTAPELVGTGDTVTQSDWSRAGGDRSQADSDWTDANGKGHASSKAPSKSLQLKKQSAAKVTPEPKPEAKKPKSQPSNIKTSSTRHTKISKAKKSEELGSEFAIPDIILSPKQRSQELDFFADMEPSLSFTSNRRTSDTKRRGSAKSGRRPSDPEDTTPPRQKDGQLTFRAFKMRSVSTDQDDNGDGWGAEGDFVWDDAAS